LTFNFDLANSQHHNTIGLDVSPSAQRLKNKKLSYRRETARHAVSVKTCHPLFEESRRSGSCEPGVQGAESPLRVCGKVPRSWGINTFGVLSKAFFVNTKNVKIAFCVLDLFPLTFKNIFGPLGGHRHYRPRMDPPLLPIVRTAGSELQGRHRVEQSRVDNTGWGEVSAPVWHTRDYTPCPEKNEIFLSKWRVLAHFERALQQISRRPLLNGQRQSREYASLFTSYLGYLCPDNDHLNSASISGKSVVGGYVHRSPPRVQATSLITLMVGTNY